MTNAQPHGTAWTDVGTFPFRQIRRHRLELIERGKREGGDYACGNVAGRFRTHLMSDPAGIHHVLVGNQRNYIRGEPEGSPLMRVLGPGLLLADGDDHRRQRRLLQPAFHPKRTAEYSHVVGDELERLLDAWRDRSGDTIDMSEEMMRLTMVIIGRILFNVDVSGNARALGHAITEANELALALGFSLAGWLPWLPTPSNLRMKRAVRRLDEAIYAIIDAPLPTGMDQRPSVRGGG